MAHQPLGTGPQDSSDTVDSLYNPSATGAAAYGYNNYNAGFFQTPNNGPQQSAGLSAFWNPSQNTQQRANHSEGVTNQAPLQQRQQQQQLTTEQVSSYMQDPMVYYGRPPYSQGMQNFNQHQPPHSNQHHQQQQQQPQQLPPLQQQQHQQQQRSQGLTLNRASMANHQPISTGHQATSYPVDSLYNSSAATAAYGYSGYNTGFFQTPNDVPQTSGSSTFWDPSSNETTLQQGQQQQIATDQVSSYMQDPPRVYQGRPPYGQVMQNFSQHQPQSIHQQQRQQQLHQPHQQSDLTHNRTSTLAQPQQMLMRHDHQQMHQFDSQHHLSTQQSQTNLQTASTVTNASTHPNEDNNMSNQAHATQTVMLSQNLQGKRAQSPNGSPQHSIQTLPSPEVENSVPMKSHLDYDQLADKICRHVIEHMNNFGICVIDNFLGSIKGELILNEVKQLFSNRSFTTGRLVNDKLKRGSLNDNGGLGGGQAAREDESQTKQTIADPTKTVRNDRVIWVDGCEEGCEEINNLIQTLCSVITNSARLSLYSNNGLDKVVIRKRTKAHVACYPGNGTRYIKHVDNPNGDGRVITAIYYLNKNWNTTRDGGLLRMFPTGVDTVANIEPLFDRVLFFWSDRRNPHEVLPSYRDRYAITVWYIGESRALEP